VKKHEHARDNEKREVLRIKLKDSFQIIKLAKKIENHCGEFGKYRVYDVDIPNEQSYLYEHDIFPIGIYNLTKNGCALEWTTNSDNTHSFDYAIPEFKTLSFEIVYKRESLWSTYDDKIHKFVIKTNDDIGIIFLNYNRSDNGESFHVY
jgi:DNA polymerase, archaea type